MDVVLGIPVDKFVHMDILSITYGQWTASGQGIIVFAHLHLIMRLL